MKKIELPLSIGSVGVSLLYISEESAERATQDLIEAELIRAARKDLIAQNPWYIETSTSEPCDKPEATE